MSKLTTKGQVTIPKAIRRHLHLEEGDEVSFEIEDDGSVNVEKAFDSDAYRKRLDGVTGIADRGLTTDEIMRITRGDDWTPEAPTLARRQGSAPDTAAE